MQDGHNAHSASADTEKPVLGCLDVSWIGLRQIADNARNRFFMREVDVLAGNRLQIFWIEDVAHGSHLSHESSECSLYRRTLPKADQPIQHRRTDGSPPEFSCQERR